MMITTGRALLSATGWGCVASSVERTTGNRCDWTLCLIAAR